MSGPQLAEASLEGVEVKDPCLAGPQLVGVGGGGEVLRPMVAGRELEQRSAMHGEAPPLPVGQLEPGRVVMEAVLLGDDVGNVLLATVDRWSPTAAPTRRSQ